MGDVVFMKTNSMILESKANALSKVKRVKANKMKLKRLEFSLKVSLLMNFILILSLDALNFPAFSVLQKLISLTLLFGVMGFTFLLFREYSRVS